MENIMIDIETLSTREDAVILSIGAVIFNPESGDIGEQFYTNTSMVSADETEENKRHIDLKTVLFWLKQPKPAQDAITDNSNRKHLNTALQDLIFFINKHSADNDLKIWAKSPTFDLTILKHAFKRYAFKTPWKYSNERDVRTCLDMAENALHMDIKNMQQKGQQHNALDDAYHQAEQVIAVYQSAFAH